MTKRIKLQTTRGYDFDLATSAMQKAIRRADAKISGYFAIELFMSGYDEYVWRRLLTISAEDCFGIITKEIWALYESYTHNKKAGKKQRIFISKAVIILALSMKSRDADHLTNLIYDKWGILEKELQENYKQNEEDIPNYAYDCHTFQGKRIGKTKSDFFKTEQNALTPLQKGLFDDLPSQC